MALTQFGWTLSLILLAGGALLTLAGAACVEAGSWLVRRTVAHYGELRRLLNTPTYCVGCGDTPRRGQMRWTWWGSYLCRNCTPSERTYRS